MFKLVILLFFLGQENPQGPFEHEEVFHSYTDCMVEATNMAMYLDTQPTVRAIMVSCQRVPEEDA